MTFVMDSYKIINDGVDSNPVVSIAIRSYNHEKFIGQTIDSILMQQIKYSYEIVIADDVSTDRNRDVMLQYQKRYPQKIKLLFQHKNVGHNRNQVNMLS